MAEKMVVCSDCGKQMPDISRTKEGWMYTEYQGVHWELSNTDVIYCKDCYRKRFPPSYGGKPCE